MLTVHRGSAGGIGISLQAVGSTARLLVPDVPICGVSSARVLPYELRDVVCMRWDGGSVGMATPKC